MIFTLSERQYKELVRRAAERAAAYRERHARSLVSLGMVLRTQDGFRVRDIARNLNRPAFNVSRSTETNTVVCDCNEFRARVKEEGRFRCAHILAVKLHLESRAGAASAQVLEFKTRAQPAKAAEDRQGGSNRGRLPRSPQLLADRCTLTMVTEALDRVAPEWQHHILYAAGSGPSRVKVIAAVTIGNITRMGTGWGDLRSPFGLQRAEESATKRAATQFRAVALELINSGGDGPATGRRGHRAEGGNHITKLRGTPAAKSAGTLITPRQLSAIRALERAAGYDRDHLSQYIFGCAADALSKRHASALITFIEEGLDTLEDEQFLQALAS